MAGCHIANDASEPRGVSSVNLERRDPAVNMARFYAVRIERTLFAEWAVIRQWGRIGTGGRSRANWFEDLGAALAEKDSNERRKRGRGYAPVSLRFAQGPGRAPTVHEVAQI